MRHLSCKWLQTRIASCVIIMLLTAQAAFSQVQRVTIEPARNRTFILCQPVIQSIDELKTYVRQAHARLAQADPALTTEAVVTFTGPMSLGEVVYFIQPVPVTGVSLTVSGDTVGSTTVRFPGTPGEIDSTKASDSSLLVISMRLTSNVASLLHMAQNSSVLCVDAGDLEAAEQHQNSQVIVTEDLHQSLSAFGPIAKASSSSSSEPYSLAQNYPNPFNPTTTISFTLPAATKVKLEVFNTLGQRVKTLYSGPLEAGPHAYEWDASGVGSGIYFYRLTAGQFVSTKKMVMLK